MVWIIKGRKNRNVYLYDDEALTLTDKAGNVVKIYESLELSDKAMEIIVDFIDGLFEKLYRNQNELSCLIRDFKEMF